jgi:hypothetical protein
MDTTDQNRKPGADATRRTARVEVTLDMATCDVKVNLECPSLDVALNLLAQATRNVEAEWRFQIAQTKAAGLVQAQKDAALAGRVLRRQ